MKHNGIDEVIKDMYILKPFYGYILCKVKRFWNNNIPTACIDINRNLSINKEFFDSLCYEDKKAIIEHEILHLALLHIPRFINYIKDPLYKEIANIAMDCAVNQLLTFKMSETLEADCVTLKSVETLVGKKLKPLMNAEYYFNELMARRDEVMNNIKQDVQQMLNNIDKGHQKMIEDSVNEQGTIDPITESILKQILQQAKEKQDEVDRKAGVNMGNYFTSFLPEYITVDKNVWKRLVNKVIGNEPSSDREYVFGKISRRKVDTYWGYKHEFVNNKVYIGIDTSGSTLREQKIFIGAIAKSLRTQEITATIIQCDFDIQDIQTNISKISINKNYKMKGGGGTDLTKILDYIEKQENNKKARLVLLTDGYTPWRKSTSVITTCIYTKDHQQLNNIMYSAVLDI